jgi:hypothetical protein
MATGRISTTDVILDRIDSMHSDLKDDIVYIRTDVRDIKTTCDVHGQNIARLDERTKILDNRVSHLEKKRTVVNPYVRSYTPTRTQGAVASGLVIIGTIISYILGIIPGV